MLSLVLAAALSMTPAPPAHYEDDVRACGKRGPQADACVEALLMSWLGGDMRACMTSDTDVEACLVTQRRRCVATHDPQSTSEDVANTFVVAVCGEAENLARDEARTRLEAQVERALAASGMAAQARQARAARRAWETYRVGWCGLEGRLAPSGISFEGDVAKNRCVRDLTRLRTERLRQTLLWLDG